MKIKVVEKDELNRHKNDQLTTLSFELREDELEEFKAKADTLGISFAELVRRSVMAYSQPSSVF